MQSQIKKLRDRENLRLFNHSTKLFTAFQLNKKESFVCWERWTKMVGGKWKLQNSYLRLHDVWNEIKKHHKPILTN